MMEKVRSLYDYKMDGLKLKQLNEGIISLTGIDMLIIILIIFTVGLIIFHLSLKMLLI